MKNCIHWLIPGESINIESISESSLASIRLRTAVARDYLRSTNFKLTVGDTIDFKSNIIIVGKVGSNAERYNYWVNQIINFKKFGAKIILDYSDHHLGFNSPMRKFYESFFNFADLIVTPSQKMTDNLMDYWSGLNCIIPDPIEVEFLTPKKNKNSYIHMLWFGHASNIDYLIDYVKRESLLNEKNKYLTVMSNHNGLDLFETKIKKLSNTNNFELINWSKDLMSEVALKADICLIPSSIDDPRKSGVSSNRLLTALALGLPTLATNMPSYQEFGKYFLDMDKYSPDYMYENIIEQKRLVSVSQNNVLKKYSKTNIGKMWFDVINLTKSI